MSPTTSYAASSIILDSESMPDLTPVIAIDKVENSSSLASPRLPRYS